jgi:hypothetical protein
VIGLSALPLRRGFVAALGSLLVTFIAVVYPWDSGHAVELQWVDSSRSAVEVSWQPQSREIAACLEDGLSYGVIYEMRLCSIRLLWTDDCTEERSTRKLSRDPISDVISITSDRLGDVAPPASLEFPLLFEALKLTAQHQFDIGLSRDARVGRVIKVRVKGRCRGHDADFFDRLPTILTLGLLSSSPNSEGDFDSGWTEFSLKDW